MSDDRNPILNSPYQEPRLHYATSQDGTLDYADIRPGRRIFTPDIQPVPARQADQGGLFEINDFTGEYRELLVNLVRAEVGKWRESGYPGTTRVTLELLRFWFDNPDRHAVRKLFFAQREAVETAVWFNEIASKSNIGQHIANRLHEARQSVSDNADQQLPRIGFKMATGTGKTVVMGMLMLYHYFNRQEYRNDTRFADYFLIVTPGVTIRERLGVLFVDKRAADRSERSDYYAVRDLVPRTLEPRLDGLNARIVITNYHALEPKTLQGNKKSPFDGKLDADGRKQEAREDFSQVVKRLLGRIRSGSRLLVLNDEAHHCYLPRSAGKTQDNEEVDENVRAAVWFSGLVEIARRFRLQQVCDLSATPYYLQGSGYEPYKLFPWVVSDFGLIEAIESGLVKIPFMPESDDTQNLSMPVLRNLYEHVRDELPKKGRRKKRAEARTEGSLFVEEPPKLPPLVKGAFDQFYNHYRHYYEGQRSRFEERAALFSSPPVFIAVCNNTSVSKEVYKFIAGYEEVDAEGNVLRVVDGHYPLFSNYDPDTNRPKHRSPTLLIDSDALENADQINDDFRKIFASELAEFKRDYARLKGQGAADCITDAEILREVVNTVGKPGKLGAHIRCVVSVSMLTEGWDANTVTHIMGLRAFGSQLLCEQVAGRALRRVNYYLQTYRKDTGELVPEKERFRFNPGNLVEKFPPEYAHIIGVPFTMFKPGTTTGANPPDYTHIRALPDRQKAFEITFPNLTGYRTGQITGEILHDFSGIEPYELDFSGFPTETTMATPFSAHQEKMRVESVLEKRDHELVFLITSALIRHHFSDDDHNPRFQLFGRLKATVEEWYDTRVQLVNQRDQRYKRLLYFEDPKKVVGHIARAINPHINTEEFIRPVFNYYNRFGSTKYVNGNTSKEVFATVKSHVNYVVMDSDWEAVAAKTLDEIPEVISYVKNQFLGFTIPYVNEGVERQYYPDFIARITARESEIPVNLIIEVTGMNREKAEKKWYVENRWLPAVNAVRERYGYGRWHFIEIANDIRDIRSQLLDKIAEINL